MPEKIQLNQSEENEMKEPKIGKFRPKKLMKTFLMVKGRGRVHTETAFLSGKALSGMLEHVTFKLTICDEGTVDFEEVDTNECDENMMKRLLDDITERNVVLYAEKTVIPSLKFSAGEEFQNQLVYLEIEEEAKPFNKLQGIFNEKPEVSNKANDFLGDLLGIDPSESNSESNEEETEEEQEEEVTDTTEKPEVVEEETSEGSMYKEMMKEALAEANAKKKAELQKRIDQCLDDKKKQTFALQTAEQQLDKIEEDLKILNTRKESMQPQLDPNGYVFYVAPGENSGVDPTDTTTIEVIEKLAPLMKLNVPAVLDVLGQTTYEIRIDRKGVYEDTEIAEDEINELVMNFDILGQTTMTNKNVFSYQGELTWHQIVDKLLKLGFEQDSEYDKLCGSPSYQSTTDNYDTSSVDAESDENPTPETPVGEKSENFKSRKLRSFKEQTIVILDANGSDVAPSVDVEINDDEEYLDLYVDGAKLDVNVRTQGFANIMTKEQFDRVMEEDGELLSSCDGWFNGVVIPNFTGDIEITGHDYSTGEFKTDFDESSFINHQEGFETINVGLNFPVGTEVYELNKDFSYPMNVLRDAMNTGVLDEDSDNSED